LAVTLQVGTASAQDAICEADHQIASAGGDFTGETLLSDDGKTLVVEGAASVAVHTLGEDGQWSLSQMLPAAADAAIAIDPATGQIAVGTVGEVAGEPRGAVDFYVRTAEGLYDLGEQHTLEGPAAPDDITFGADGTMYAVGGGGAGSVVVQAAYGDTCCLTGTIPNTTWNGTWRLAPTTDGVAAAGLDPTGVGRIFAMTLTPEGDTASWTAIDEVAAPPLADDATFGASLAAAGGTLLIGSPGDGAAFVYEQGDAGWALAQTLKPGAHSAFEGNADAFADLVSARDAIAAIDANAFDPAQAQAALDLLAPVLALTAQGAIFTAVVPFEDDPTGMPYAITTVINGTLESPGSAPAELEDYYFEQDANPVVNFDSSPDLHISAFFVVYDAATDQWLLNAVAQGDNVNAVTEVEFEFLEPYDPPPSDVFAAGLRQVVDTFWDPSDIAAAAKTLEALVAEGEGQTSAWIADQKASALAPVSKSVDAGAGSADFGGSVALSGDGGWAAVGGSGAAADYVYSFPRVAEGGGSGGAVFLDGGPGGNILSGTLPAQYPPGWGYQGAFASGFPPGNVLSGTIPNYEPWGMRVAIGNNGNNSAGATVAVASPRAGVVVFDDISSCAVVTDSDGDGIADDVDACPTEPAGAYDNDMDGCPDGRDLVAEALNQLAAELFDELEIAAADASNQKQKRVKQARKQVEKALTKFDAGKDDAAFNKLSAAVTLIPRSLEGGDAARLEIASYGETIFNIVIAELLDVLAEAGIEVSAEFDALIEAMVADIGVAIDNDQPAAALRKVRRYKKKLELVRPDREVRDRR
jgi:hypothetical protein